MILAFRGRAITFPYNRPLLNATYSRLRTHRQCSDSPPNTRKSTYIVVTPPIAIIVCIAGPVHEATSQLASAEAANCSPEAVIVTTTLCAGVVGRGITAAELANIAAAFCATVAVIVLLARAAGVGTG